MSKDRAEQLVEAGIWLRLSGDLEGARRLFEQALLLDPDNARAREMSDGAARAAAPQARPPDPVPHPLQGAASQVGADGYASATSPRPFGSPSQVVNLTPSDADLKRLAATPTIPPPQGTPAPLGPGELGLDPLTPRSVVLGQEAEPARKPLFTPPPVSPAQVIPTHTRVFGAQAPAPHTMMFGGQPPAAAAVQPIPSQTLVFGKAPAPSAPDPFPPQQPPAPDAPSGGRTMMFGPSPTASAPPVAPPTPLAAPSGPHTMMFGGDLAQGPAAGTFDPEQTNPYGSFPKERLMPPPPPAPPPGAPAQAGPPRATLPFGMSDGSRPPAEPTPQAPGNFVPWDLPDSGAFKVDGASSGPAQSSHFPTPAPPAIAPLTQTADLAMRVVAEAPLLTSTPSAPAAQSTPGPRTINAAAALLSAVMGEAPRQAPKSPSAIRPAMVPTGSTPLPSVAPSIAPLPEESPMRVTGASPSRPPLAGLDASAAGAPRPPTRPPVPGLEVSAAVPRPPTRPPVADEPPSPLQVTRSSPSRPAVEEDPSPMKVTRSSPSRPPREEDASPMKVTRSSPSRPPIDEAPSPVQVSVASPLGQNRQAPTPAVPPPLTRADPKEPIPSNRGPVKGVSGVWTAVPEASPARPASQPTDDAWNWGNAAAPGEPEPAALELPMFPSPVPFSSPSPALASNAESAWDQRSNPGIKLQSRESGAGMDMLARDRKTPAPPSSEPKGNVTSLLKGARNMLELDDHTGAMDLILKAQALAPDSAEVQQMRERSEKTLIAMYESKIGKVETKPRVLLKNDEIIWLNLDHRAGFVLAQIDGTVTFDDLFAVSGMSRFDTAKILAQMIDEGVISRG